MNFDILESLNSALGGPVTRQLSAFLEENEGSTRSAIRSIGPALLAGLMQQATTPSGEADIFAAVNDERIDSGIVGKLGTVLGNRGTVDSMRGVGESFLNTLFGDRTGAIADATSEVTGVRPKSALSLLSMGLPVMLGMLRKQVTNNDLDSSGLASLLFSQRHALERTGLDSHIANALGFNGLSSLLAAVPSASAAQGGTAHRTPVVQERELRRSSWLPWAIAAGVAVLAVLLWFNRAGSPADVAPATSARLYFDSDETTIARQHRVKLASVAVSARDQNRPVTIRPYADPRGNTAQNVKMAQGRAAAVRNALVEEGVPESRIVVDPPATVTALATDAEARRVDVVVR